MALLSATQGSPERIFSLLRILSANEGSLERPEVIAWLNPKFDGQQAKDERSAVDQTIQAALGLRLIDTSDRNRVRLMLPDAPKSFAEFSDLIHATLSTMRSDDADAVLFEVFAWLTAQVQIQGSTLWVEGWSTKQFADKANEALMADASGTGDPRFNVTKRAPWRRWIEFVGLSVTLPTGQEHPCVTWRLERELFNGALPTDQEVDARKLLAHISERMPYLDGGHLFEKFCAKLNHRIAPGMISRILSMGLRDLAAEGRIQFFLRGDARDHYELAPDRYSKFQSFTSVRLNSEAVFNGST